MATVYVSLGRAGQHFGDLPVFTGPMRSETISSSGTAASGALVAAGDEYAQVFCASAVYASTTGTASASAGLYIPAGIPGYLLCGPGRSVSVIDV